MYNIIYYSLFLLSVFSLSYLLFSIFNSIKQYLTNINGNPNSNNSSSSRAGYSGNNSGGGNPNNNNPESEPLYESAEDRRKRLNRERE